MQRNSNGWYREGRHRHSNSRASSPARPRSAGSSAKYKDPSLQELNGFLFDASLIYAMSALTNVKLTATTVASETTVPGTAGVLTRNAGVEIEHSFRRWLDRRGEVQLRPRRLCRLDAQGRPLFGRPARSPTSSTAWRRSRGEVRQEWLRSNVPGVDYARIGDSARHAAAALSPTVLSSSARNAGAMSSRASA